ncbi:MAG: hypothetical protein M3N42_16175 [Cyanobacteriota bacterium]|nr:hypothetical protein [Cyanobacteriota bacterium]
MVDDDSIEFQSPITLDRVLFAGRRRLGLSQREFAEELSDKYHQIDHIVYSKIENARIDIRLGEWDWLIPKFSSWLQIDQHWLESIRQQTEVKPLTLDGPALITYARKFEVK